MAIPDVVMIIGGFAVIGAGVLHVAIGTFERIRGMNEIARPDQLAEMDERLARIEAAVESLAVELERANELQRLSERVADPPRLPERREGRTFNTPH